jgi:hypothetical protein
MNSRFHLASTSLLLALAATVTPIALDAQQDGNGRGRPMASVTRITTTPPIIDGRLDDEAWVLGQPITDFFQREPVEGEPVSERTEVRILADGEALYVGAWLYDRSPDDIVTGERLRDANIQVADHFGIILDTYRDRQNGFVFSTTPSAIEYDAQVVTEGVGGGRVPGGGRRQQAGSSGGFNLNWDGSWEVATSRNGEGWYAEFRIPFSTLRYAGGSVQTWGFNMVRRIRRRNEESFWAPIPRQYNLMRLSIAGDLAGVPVPVQRAATVTPYVLSSADRDYVNAPGDTEYPSDVGVDAKITLTPSLTLDLTTNTDFAQVEVDEQRTNLTRFPLFFPEKRPFFLENAGTFAMGTPRAVDLFFSRKIGISPGGNAVPILGGGRLSGKVRGLGVGFVQIFTDGLDEDLESGVRENSFSVARVTRELPNRSRAGAMFVQRRATHDGDDFNRTYAVDGRLGIGDRWTVDAWLARTETPGLDGSDAAVNVNLLYEIRDFSMSVQYRAVGKDFNPEVGFTNRVGYRYFDANIRKAFRMPSVSWIREFSPHMNSRYHWDLDGTLSTGYFHFDPEFVTEGGGLFGPEFNFQSEGLTEPFEISPGVVIPVGNYRDFIPGFEMRTDPSARLSLRTMLRTGQFFSGIRYGGDATITYRQGENITADLRLDHNIVRLDEGDFETTLVGLKVGYFFTPRIFLQTLLQYSDQADVWSVNTRFGWLDTAGTGLYVVYNEAQESHGLTSLTGPMSRSFIVKYSRQLRVL